MSRPILTWNGPDSLQGRELCVGGGGGDKGEADLRRLGPGPELSLWRHLEPIRTGMESWKTSCQEHRGGQALGQSRLLITLKRFLKGWEKNRNNLKKYSYNRVLKWTWSATAAFAQSADYCQERKTKPSKRSKHSKTQLNKTSEFKYIYYCMI